MNVHINKKCNTAFGDLLYKKQAVRSQLFRTREIAKTQNDALVQAACGGQHSAGRTSLGTTS